MFCHQMPLLDHCRLQDDDERRLAVTLLSFMGSGYVWQDGHAGVTKVVFYGTSLYDRYRRYLYHKIVIINQCT